MKKTRMTRMVSFRVSDEQLAALTTMAVAAGVPVGDWCRDTVLAAAKNDHGLTPNEQVIFEEVARLRYLVGLGFGLIADSRMTREELDKVRRDAEEQGGYIAKKILARRRSTP